LRLTFAELRLELFRLQQGVDEIHEQRYGDEGEE
jgi:hypothetical protein